MPTTAPGARVAQPANVRLALPQDEPAIFALLCMLHEENGMGALDPEKGHAMIRKGTDRKGGLIGIIDGPDGKPVASTGILLTQWWYSSAWHLEEVWNFVHPDHRRTSYAHDLINFGKWASGDLTAKHGSEGAPLPAQTAADRRALPLQTRRGITMCKGGSDSTTTTNSQPPAQVLQAYTNLVNQAQKVSNQPLQQYQGSTVAGFTPDQETAMQTVDNAQGMSQPYTNAATQLAGNATGNIASSLTPVNSTSLAAYESPYTAQVVNSTMANAQQQDALQQDALKSGAMGSGAFGGDRAGLASAALSGQQDLANNQTVSSLENQGFNTALGEANTVNSQNLTAAQETASNNLKAGEDISGFGTTAENNALTGAQAQMNSGTTQQQLAQSELNVPYQAFQQAQSYPFQATQWLGNIVEGTGSLSGGTSSSTTSSARGGGIGFASGGTPGSLGSLAMSTPFGSAQLPSTAGRLTLALTVFCVIPISWEYNADGARLQRRSRSANAG